MSLAELLNHLEGTSFAQLEQYRDVDVAFAVDDGARSLALSALLRARIAAHPEATQLLVIAPTSREASRLADEFQAFFDTAEVFEFIASETLPHEQMSPSVETVGRRLSALRRILEHRSAPSADRVPQIVVASVRAVAQPVMSVAELPEALELRVQRADVPPLELARRLVDLRYERVDMVSRRGEFAVRGGIVDLFAANAEHAVRIEYFGDEIEFIKPFAVSDQRSTGEVVDSQDVLPAGEAVSEGASITDFFGEAAAIAVVSPERVEARLAQLIETDAEFAESAWRVAESEQAAPKRDAGFMTLAEIRERSAPRPWWSATPFAHGPDSLDQDVVVHTNALHLEKPDPNAPLRYLQERVAQGWSATVTIAGHGLMARARELLTEFGLTVADGETLAPSLSRSQVTIVSAALSSGFEIAEAKVTVMAEADFFGRSVGATAPERTKIASKRKNVVDPLKLLPGDYVVHEIHGIGRFRELAQRMIPSGSGRNATKVPREYVVLEYASSKRGMPSDKLYVPTDQLDQLSRYVGGEAPALSKMGGSDWAAAKGRARKAVREIAVELVKLYAERKQAKGFAFSPDTPWQRELEDAFAFAETPDQLTSIEEVKRDMESSVPMDRLISGDVGFGKTEIAVRAAFKAIQDNKQVAMLVPTTLLVKQHLATFEDRFAGFPVQVRALSRFQSEREVRETIAGLADGTVDMVIGTHRLLSESVRYRDLGLLIIDEEQRFGVEHKDALKKLKTNVDILAMSATPIPRTLEMAVTGIREMSTLATAPEDRHPILTYVGPRNTRQIAAAIRREMLREGQVFFVHNRVRSISAVAQELAELVPEARVAVAHGQMGEAELERVVVDFWERKYDVLVSTTIIETGLDIANANTIIIDRAERYGLSQLHQLRGRVGRSRERAYAYFFTADDEALSETALARLETIARNNELGAGMQVAMKDLELRGAGNLLGEDQSGHIAGVGFDLYLRMIGEAVSAFRGVEPSETNELTLEIPVDAHLPDEYIDSERLRLEAYQKISAASHPSAADNALELVHAELEDRYGELPVAAVRLLQVSRLRRRLNAANIRKIITAANTVRIEGIELPESRQMRAQRMYPGSSYTTEGHILKLKHPEAAGLPLRDEHFIEWVQQLFDNLIDTTQPADAGTQASQ